MAKVGFTYSFDRAGVRISFEEKGLIGPRRCIPVSQWHAKAQGQEINAVSVLLGWADDDDVLVDDDSISVPHVRVAELDSKIASLLSLPPPPPFVLNVQGQGTVDQETFNLNLAWLDLGGQPAMGISRTGAILTQASRAFRVPEPIYTLVETIDRFNAQTQKDSANRLKAWAAIQDLLATDGDAQIRSEGYLLNTRIAHASAFSLSLRSGDRGFDFDPVLFGPMIPSRSSGGLDSEDGEDDQDPVSEAAHLLPPVQQRFFAENRFANDAQTQDRYALRDGWYVVMDEPVRRALDVVRRAKKSDADTRRAFAKNPRAFIRNELGEEFDDGLIDTIFVETAEYSVRIVDIGLWQKPVIPWVQQTADKWLPEKFGLKIGDRTVFLNEPEIPELRRHVVDAISKSAPTVSWKGEEVPASKQTLEALDTLFAQVAPEKTIEDKDEKADEADEEPEGSDVPVVLIIDDNFEQAGAKRQAVPRGNGASSEIPLCLKTTSLKPHQIDGLKWLQAAWRKGQAGVLLADDMGLGKTLMSLAFLGWLRQAMEERTVRHSPILIVAPTGLLKNWEREHDLHLHQPGLGDCWPAYGSGLRDIRLTAKKELAFGQSTLDTETLRTRDWVLTTYETLRDYQHSFASVRFAAIVFDEIQKTKTPGTVMTHAAKAMNGDFCIGLTGTPIENRLADLWCIVDTLEPGYLGDLKTFSATYEKDKDPDALNQLKCLLKDPQDSLEPVMLRRMKDGNLEGLPKKEERICAAEMPASQKNAYSDAIIQAQTKSGKGKMLEALHALKSISLHPNHPQAAEYPGYLAESARLSQLFEVLDGIEAKREKALIFVESLDMQEPLAGFIKRRYKLINQPMIISGSVTGPKRQERVNRFQDATAEEFDVMILSPRAGGVGLTLTAANHVIHLSRWWNPAVEDQCTDRVYRIGQTKPVQVYYLQATHPDFPERSFDERLHDLLMRKRALSRDMLVPPVDVAQDTNELYKATVENGSPGNGLSDQAQSPLEYPSDVTLVDIDAMEPVQFEDWCLGRLKRLGFIVSRTKKSWDCGADGIAEDKETGKCVIIQCKHTQTTHACDDRAVEELLNARIAYDRPDAVLCAITNAEKFTDYASRLAADKGVTLIARPSLLVWRPPMNDQI